MENIQIYRGRRIVKRLKKKVAMSSQTNYVFNPAYFIFDNIIFHLLHI